MNKRPSPAMVVAVIALVMSMTGGAIAAVNYAANAGAVDGKSAVKAGSSLNKSAGKLVATYPGGADKGKIPLRNLADVASASALDAVADASARGKNGAQLIAVPDNAETTPATLLDLELGTLQVVCFDEATGQNGTGRENPATRLTINNTSGAGINVSIRVGVGAPAIRTIENGTAEVFEVGTQNTFEVQLNGGEKTVLVDGTARQAGQGTDNGSCGVFATAILVD